MIYSLLYKSFHTRFFLLFRMIIIDLKLFQKVKKEKSIILKSFI